MQQTLPEFARVLSDEELETFSKYKHSSPKTTFEQWMIDYPAGWVERKFPSFLSANTLTLIGQIPVTVLAFVLLWRTGGNIPKVNDDVRGLIMVGAFSLYWFSVIDIADGCRARRLKVGSPLGRIVDEAGDLISQAQYSLVIAMAVGFDNVYAECLFLMLNVIFYCMELNHKVTGKLQMVIGELGPVEAELLLSILVFYLGYHGNSFLQKSVTETFEFAPDSQIAGQIGDWRLVSLLMVPLSGIVLLFLEDNLISAMRVNFGRCIHFAIPMFYCAGSYIAISTLPSYQEQRGVCILFVNYVIANVTFNFMMNIMAGQKYCSFAQPTLLMLQVPLIAYHGFGVSAETEQTMTLASTVFLFVLFVAKMASVSKQWVDFSGKPFFTIPTTPAASTTGSSQKQKSN